MEAVRNVIVQLEAGAQDPILVDTRIGHAEAAASRRVEGSQERVERARGGRWGPALARWDEMEAVHNAIVQLGAGAQEPPLVDTRIGDAEAGASRNGSCHQHDAEIAVAVRETESGGRAGAATLTRIASCSASYWTATSSTWTSKTLWQTVLASTNSLSRRPRGSP
jgi:hypothetical protein